MTSTTPANVRVLVRIRPQNRRERAKQSTKHSILSVHGDSIQLNAAVAGSEDFGTNIDKAKLFRFDAVLGPRTTQPEVFERTKSIVEACVNGYNGTILAYGQTGSGKTYTAFGNPGEEQSSCSAGLVQRSIRELFQGLSRKSAEDALNSYISDEDDNIFNAIDNDPRTTLEKTASKYKLRHTTSVVHASFFEIFNEKIHDLLANDEMDLGRSLNVRENATTKTVYVDGLSESVVANSEEAERVIARGLKNRTVASTKMNHASSRSHALLVLRIKTTTVTPAGITKVQQSKFTLVDLAGSERQKLTETEGARLKEASMINKSLSCLGQVINSLVDLEAGKERHVPYRDSKLTFLLRDSLGGNSKTCLIATVSPSIESINETLSTLQFAQRAKLIKNSVTINEDVVGSVEALRAEIARLQSELKFSGCEKLKARRSVRVARSQNGSSISTSTKLIFDKSPSEEPMRSQLDIQNSSHFRLNSSPISSPTQESVVRSLKRKLDEERMVSKFKQSRIELLSKSRAAESNSEIVILSEELESLRRQLNGPHPEAVKWKAAYESLKEELDRKGLIQSAEVHRNAFEAEIEKLTMDKEKLEERIKNLLKNNAEKMKRSEETKLLRSDVLRLEHEITKLKIKADTAQANLDIERRASDQLAREADNIMVELSETKIKLRDLQEECDRLRDKVTDKERALFYIQQELEQQAQTSESDSGELRVKLEAVSKENSELLKQLESVMTSELQAQQKILDLENKLVCVQKDTESQLQLEREASDELAREADRITSELEKARAELEKVREESSELRNQLEVKKLSTFVADLSHETLACQTNDSLDSNILESLSKEEIAIGKIEELEKELQIELAQAGPTLDYIGLEDGAEDFQVDEVQNEMVEDVVEVLRTELESKDKTIDEFKEIAHIQAIENQDAQNTLHEKLASLSAENENLLRLMDEAIESERLQNSKIKDLESALKTVQDDLAVSRRVISSKEQDLEKMQNNMSSLEIECVGLKCKVSDLEKCAQNDRDTSREILQKEQQAHDKSIQTLRSEIHDLSEKLKAAHEKTSALEVERNKSQDKYKHLQATLKLSEMEKKDLTTSLNDRIRNLEDEITNLQKENFSLKTQLQSKIDIIKGPENPHVGKTQELTQDKTQVIETLDSSMESLDEDDFLPPDLKVSRLLNDSAKIPSGEEKETAYYGADDSTSDEEEDESMFLPTITFPESEAVAESLQSPSAISLDNKLKECMSAVLTLPKSVKRPPLSKLFSNSHSTPSGKDFSSVKKQRNPSTSHIKLTRSASKSNEVRTLQFL